MRLLSFYLCLLAILFQPIFASSSSNGKDAALKSKKPGSSKPKKVIGTPVGKRKLPSTSNKLPTTKNKKIRKSRDIMAKKNRTRLLAELLPRELVKLVIDYFNDDTYPFIVSTHNWLLESITGIAVDSARVYVVTKSEGIKGLGHSLANVKENEHRCIELGNPKWSYYLWSGSSHDGRYVSFSHGYEGSADCEEQQTKWLFMQANEPEDGGFKPVAFGGGDWPCGLLSQNGQMLISYNEDDSPMRVYQAMEGAGKDLVVLMKFELSGAPCTVSGKGNCVILKTSEDEFEIHDISKDTSRLVCQLDRTVFGEYCALNEEGSKAAFLNDEKELRIVEVDKASDSGIDQSAIVKVKAPGSLGQIGQLMYDNRGKLYVLHDGDKVSLFGLSTKEFTLLEVPQKGQQVVEWAISPNADYIALLLGLGEGDGHLKFKQYQTIVKRKLDGIDFEGLFGFKAARPGSKEHEQYGQLRAEAINK